MFFLERPRILAIGAHPDDIELGAAGFIFRMVREKSAFVDHLVLTPGLHAQQGRFVEVTRQSEAEAAGGQLGVRKVEVLKFSDCRLHEAGHELIREIEQHLYGEGGDNYDIVLSHAYPDTHQDHRSANEATLSAARNFAGTILLYQTPSTRSNEFCPNYHVALSEEVMREKDAVLMRHISQREKRFMRWERTVLVARAAGENNKMNTFLEEFELHRCLWR